ncbi:hypothetical protein [Chryseobacterium sp. JM1]|uniref:hypothetical protein n=1 Tax=Chryseobacterium sp. JM1 TaxID=1233950 RepID=UPI0004E6F47C|nr:hypothetical protein [Chryseobacterium sp. JM1]KFF16995.1 hypothetical protein IW22_21655 [Chryseobacterium sp. JM1]
MTSELISTKIVVVHDDMDEDYPLIVMLKDKYSDENVIFFKHSQEGLNYVLENLGKKMVVLLDKNFKDKDDISGLKVFEKIREKTALVYIVLISANSITDFSEEELKILINKDLFKLEKFTTDYKSIIELIDEAVNSIDMRVDAAIEDWLMINKLEDTKPILITETAQYTLKDILKEIRLDSNVGKDFVRKVNALTIELIMRNKEKIS